MSHHLPRSTVALIVASFALVLSSCGSSSGDDSSPELDSTQAETTAAGEPATSEADTPPTPAGPVGATVTVGDETFEAANVGACVGVGSTFVAQFFNDDESVTIALQIPPEDWESQPEGAYEPPSIQVFTSQGGTQSQWLAGEAEFGSSPAVSEVGNSSVDVQAGTAEGDATFVDQTLVDSGETAEVLTGSFSANCG